MAIFSKYLVLAVGSRLVAYADSLGVAAAELGSSAMENTTHSNYEERIRLLNVLLETAQHQSKSEVQTMLKLVKVKRRVG